GAWDAQLEAGGGEASVAAVLVRGAGERGFCAGGDVRAIHAARRRPPGPGDYKTDLYREEYRFIRKVHRLSKPYVALAHGITMGGGVGLSTNGRYRVATETTEVAMPEVFIGSIPDVGATRFFHMCPGRIGTYLALTGRRIGAADAIYCGLLTHYVRQDRLAALTEALAERDAETTLDRFAESPGPSKLAALRPAIDRCFGRPSVEAILDALHAEDAEWAWAAMTAMERACPTSLKLTFRQLRRGAGMDLEAALALEDRLTMHILAGDDFYDRVLALLIDRARRPRWRFASAAEVSEAEVERHFAPLGEGELTFA